ncbi:DNA-binding MarR family transcriptional regulator [Nocardia transvalensis]|uniref:DNA-binding MarR family transcriptional regulator n=1 Tax=Nocardia transvalensis TaxID=37333 RepID=A0A7W9PJ36_9NOCA|nr:MarR family transcriptional regulator [Nocardia transvalensis]MBB5916559.1 DNA-binding MarR family transcriptional regulator [Nocardia transvalensis]
MSTPGSAGAPSLLYLVKRLELTIRAHLDDMLRGSGVTTPQYTALTVLIRRDGISAAQLARDSFVTPQSMADMLRPLQQRGLVHRIANPHNRREVLIHLTPAGRDLVDRYDAAATAIERRMLADLTGPQIDAFRDALTSARSALHPGSARSEPRPL